MTRKEKNEVIKELNEKFSQYETFYFTDASGLSVEVLNKLRRSCHEQGVILRAAKNTLVKKAMESNEQNFEEFYDTLKGPTFLMFSESSNAPAKVMKSFREDQDKPVLKAAYIEKDTFFGDDQLEMLANLKSKEELVGDVIGILQSPMKNVISGLKSGGDKIAGIVKTLSEKSEE